MKILVVAPSIPHPMDGFATRNYYILKTLASRHSVSLFVLDRGMAGIDYDITMLEDMTNELKVFTRPKVLPKRWEQLISTIRGKLHILNDHYAEEMQKALDEAMLSNHYDVILFESSLTAGYHLPPNVFVIIDQHNIEYELLLRTSMHETALLRKWYNRIQGNRLKPIEIERCGRANLILVTSEREYLELKQLLPQSAIKVVPNGVDEEAFQPQEVDLEIKDKIVFTGAMDYYPNVDAVCFFAQHCWPLIRASIPSATWQIVGKNPMPDVLQLAKLPGVSVTGTVPNTKPYLTTASIAIAPLRIGSGTRLKILEAFAMQKAVVSTGLGCEGLTVEAGRHLLVADQPEAFAEAIITLLNQPEKRRELGFAGRMLVETTYSWEQCGNPLLQLLTEMEPSLHK